MRRVVLNGTQIDIGREEGISINYAVSDVRNVDSGRGDYSHTLRIPLSKTNRKVFGFPEQLDSSSAYDNSTKYTATVEVDGIVVLDGYCRIIEVNRSLVGGEIGIMLISGNGNWIGDMTGVKLAVLAALSDYDHTYISGAILSSWSRDLGYFYPVIDHGVLSGGQGYAVEDYRMAFKVATLMEMAFNAYGYKVESDFLSSAFGQGLYMIPGRRANFPESYRAARAAKVGLASDQSLPSLAVQNVTFKVQLNDTTSPFYNSDEGNFNTSSYSYVADVNCKQDFTFHYYLNWALSPPVNYANNIRVYGRIMRDSGGTISTLVEEYIDASWPNEVITSVTIEGARLQAGDKVYAEIEIEPLSLTFPGLELLATETYLVNKMHPEIIEGSPVFTSSAMPDREVVEFIRGVKHLFNLYFYTNNRTVYIEPAEDFYSDTVVDWSDKIDISHARKIRYIDEYPKEITYGYKEDSADALMESIEMIQPLGDYTYTMAGEFLRGEEERRNDFFAPTLMKLGRVQGFKSVKVPYIWGDTEVIPPEQVEEYEPRILFFSGLEFNTPWYNLGGTSIKFPRVYSYRDDQGNNNSLLFDDNNASKGLFTRYYRNTYATASGGKLYTVQALLTPADIVSLDPRKRVRVGQQVFRLNKITGYNGRGTCEVELLVEAHRTGYVPVTDGAAIDDPQQYDSLPRRVVPLLAEDTRVRPSNLIELFFEDEQGVLQKLYTEI